MQTATQKTRDARGTLVTSPEPIGLRDRRSGDTRTRRVIDSATRAVRPLRDTSARIEPLDRRMLLSAGDIDTSFGGAGAGGLVRQHFGTGDDHAYAVTMQADGRILIAGTVRGPGGSFDFGLLRLMPDGTPDPSFGSAGKVMTNLGLNGANPADEARAVAVDPGGRIYVAGYTNRAGGVDFALARYLANGSLDSSFGTAGIAVNSFGTTDQAFAIALQADGKVLLAGMMAADFGVARYNVNGTLDTTFSAGSGFVRTNIGTGTDLATAMVLRPDGRIVVGGHSQFGSDFDFTVAAYTPFGTLDSSFNGTGTASVSVGVSDTSTSLTLMPDGRVVLGGKSDGNVQLIRFNTNGTRDGTFGSAGVASIDFGSTSDAVNSILVMPDGSLVGAGATGTGSSRNFLLFRVGASGTVDMGFGVSGSVQADFTGDVDEAFALVRADLDSAVVVGRSGARSGVTTTYDFGAARYTVRVNHAPGAVIGGPSSVDEGATTQLSGSSSTDDDGSIVSYEWDFDFDGSTFDVNAIGANATFDASSLNGPTTRRVALRVTDNEGATHVVEHLMSVVNVGPSATLNGPTSGDSGQQLTWTVDFTDPGAGETYRVVWELSDGTTFETTLTGGTTNFMSFSHGFSTGGAHSVKVTVFDGDGGESSATLAVNIAQPPPPPPPPPPSLVELVDDPNHPGKKMLVVHGTDADDIIRFRHAKHGKVEVRVNSVKLGVFNVSSRIVAYGMGGNDVIFADDAVRAWGQFYGGAGNDVLKGTRRGDRLDGGDGNDLLFGRRGNDLLLGGDGSDTLHGQQGNDTLNGGAGRDYMRDCWGRNQIEYDDLDWRPRKRR